MDITDKTHLTFNTLDWYEYDEIIKKPENIMEEKKDQNEEEKKNEIKRKEYIIKVFGKTKNGESVYLRIYNFTPHFYISYDQSWTDKKIDIFINHIISLRPNLQHHLINYDVVKKKNFYGFVDKPQTYLRLISINLIIK